jgi:hypothetical protein
MTSQTALVVVDVQDGIANSTYGVPDAGEITHAISSIVPLARLHNETQSGSQGSKNSVEILLIQHDDKDPEDPLYRGKATWKLLFPPRQGVLGDMFSPNPDLAASLRGARRQASRLRGVANRLLRTGFDFRGNRVWIRSLRHHSTPGSSLDV